ncbi:MAG TPA: hypothetical protein VE964_16285 [Myxococcales bacterium]|nr:hypothetical protein [Myxococcales bacterium]
MQTPSPADTRQQKLARIQLVARVQLAYEQLRDLAFRAGARAQNDRAVREARTHLDALNTLLALLTLQAE